MCERLKALIRASGMPLLAMLLGSGFAQAQPPSTNAPSTNTIAVLTNATSAPRESKEVKGLVSRPKKDFQIKLVTNAAPATKAASKRSATVEKGFYWEFYCAGWEGFRMGFSQ